MNNHGQLGINNQTFKATPVRVPDLDPFEGDYFVHFAGGEHHTIGLMDSGCVYSFGNNEEGQIGLGDLFGEYNRKRRAEEQEQPKTEEAKVEEELSLSQAGTKRKKRNPGAKGSKKKVDNLKYIAYFPRP
jgi:alpha-tubulin suppressor-like RCC1 family protein